MATANHADLSGVLECHLGCGGRHNRRRTRLCARGSDLQVVLGNVPIRCPLTLSLSPHTVIELLADALDAQLSIALAITASPSQTRIQNLLTIMSRLAGLFPGSKVTVSPRGAPIPRGHGAQTSVHFSS